MGRAEDLYDRIVRDGVKAIDEMIAAQQSEELFLDFKGSKDDGKGSTLHDDDRNNLAKAISGFGNSAGGVVVWGVDCRRDKSGADIPKKMPLADAKRFRSLLEGAVSGRTIPPHKGVIHSAIEIGDGPQGFVATLVPESDTAPHQAVGKYLYYMRAGSAFVPVLHQVLAGMFGRRPQPVIVAAWEEQTLENAGTTLTPVVYLLFENRGPVTARDVFVVAEIESFGGPNSTANLQYMHNHFTPSVNWTEKLGEGAIRHMVSGPAYGFPPGAREKVLRVAPSFAPPFDRDFRCTFTVGCEGAPPLKLELRTDAESLSRVYMQVTTDLDRDKRDDSYKKQIVRQLLGLQQ